MNSYSLEKKRLKGTSFEVKPRIDRVHESVQLWSELSLKEQAETLNLVRLILSQLTKNIQFSWKAKELIEALVAYREWEGYIANTRVIQEALTSIKSDPTGAPLDYQWEIARDREKTNYLFDRIMRMSDAEFSVAVFLTNISDETEEVTLKTLTRYEADNHFKKDEVSIITSFVNACKASSDLGRYTRVGEIATDYYLSHYFSGSICRKTALMWFNQTKMLEPALDGLIKRAIVKRMIRSVWVMYWATRLQFKIFVDDQLAKELLASHLE